MWFVVEVGHVCNYFTEAAALICSLIVFMKRIIWRAKICSPPSSDEQGDTGCALSLHWLCIPLAAYVSACHLPSSIGLHCTVWGHSSMTELPKALCCCVFITLGILEFVDVQMPSNRKGIQIG